MATNAFSTLSFNSNVDYGTRNFTYDDYDNADRSGYAFQRPLRCRYAKTFVHQPLKRKTRQIRVLKIDPALDPGEIPRCCIHTVELSLAPVYLALSYTWGSDDAPIYDIVIDGRTYGVKESLCQFLCFFRNKVVNCDRVYIWIDQICINQQDSIEKNYSVRLMPQIYHKAEYVIQWLGCDVEMVEAAREFHRTTSTESLGVLLNNHYFTRLWIVQEVLLATTVQVLCGNIWLSFQDIERRTHEEDRMISRRQNQNIPYPSLFLLWDGIHNRHGRTLEICISKYSANACQNPRDKVYALLGLVKEDGQLNVDYEKSVPQVFLDAVQVLARSQFRREASTKSIHTSVAQFRVSVALFLAKNMGLYRELDDHLYHHPGLTTERRSQHLRYFLDEIRTKEPGPEWFQKVLRCLDHAQGEADNGQETGDEEEAVNEEETEDAVENRDEENFGS